MQKLPFIICISIVILAALSLTPVSARWVEGGNAVCDTTGLQYDTVIFTADDGNCIVVWRDSRTAQWELYANKIDIYGNTLWGSKGVLICNGPNAESKPKAVTDGAGGAIVVWEDQRSGYDIYAQRVDTDGVVQWALSGVAISTAGNYQQYQQIVSDGEGGAIVTWADERSGHDIYAQRVDSSGAVQWTADGVAVCTYPYNQVTPRIASDLDGGAIIAWADYRNVTYGAVYAQRVDGANGYPQWITDGIPLESSTDNQGRPDITSDGTGGAIVVWDNSQASGDYTIYATRISADSLLQWGGAVEIYAGTGDMRYPRVTADGAGGAIAVFEDWNNGEYESDLRAQRVDISGTVMWPGGATICTAPGKQEDPIVCPDGFGGAIFTWDDYRAVKGDIYAQRVDASGAVLWDYNGAVVVQKGDNQVLPSIAPDGQAGAILSYIDITGEVDYEVLVQRIERNGYWGYPAPHIAGVRDIPGDQGGFVNLSWDASRLDPWPEMLISSYTVWRAISPVAATANRSAGVRVIDTPAALGESDDKKTILVGKHAGQTYYWYLIDTVQPYYLPGYSVPAATMFDSTSTSAEYHYFQVIAHTTDPQTFWVSDPDSGYSVDNVGPCVPECLAGEQKQSPAGLYITWLQNGEADLDGYRIYRGTSDDFVPDTDNLIAEPPDTCYLDGGWNWAAGYYYKVSAVDVHGNESGYALLTPDALTGAETAVSPQRTFLAQNHPNPFNPVTSIRFGLKVEGEVSLRIYDASGRLVRELVNQSREAGSYNETWDGKDRRGRSVASGVYFYRLESGSFKQSRKMVLLR